jgi:hypothetical protein
LSEFTISTEDLARNGTLEVRKLALTDGSHRAFVIADPTGLASDDPILLLLPADGLVRVGKIGQVGTLMVLVLGEPGPDGRPLAGYSAADTASLTTAFRAAQVAADDAFQAKLRAHGYRDIGGGQLGLFAEGAWPTGTESAEGGKPE